MDTKFFNEETGEICNNDPVAYANNIRQLAKDLKESQGGYDPASLEVVMEVGKNKPTGWDEFVSDMIAVGGGWSNTD